MTIQEKIKGQANIDIFNLHKAQEQGVITEFGKGKLEALEGIVDFIDSLQEEPVSEGQVKEDTMTIRKEWFEHCKKSWYNEGYIDGEYNRDRKFEETVSEDLVDATNNYCVNVRKGYPRIMDETDRYICNAFKAGAKWKAKNLWKPAAGKDLPEIDREVIALKGIVDPTATDCLCGYEVIFAHRPDTKGYDGKSITTGETKHYTPKTYGEGGWNIPDVKYWLDVEIQKEIEL